MKTVKEQEDEKLADNIAVKFDSDWDEKANEEIAYFASLETIKQVDAHWQESYQALEKRNEELECALKSMCKAHGDIAFTVGAGGCTSEGQWMKADKVLDSSRKVLKALTPEGEG